MVARVVPVTRLRRDTTSWSYVLPPTLSCSVGSLVVVPFRGHDCLGVVWELLKADELATVSVTEVLTPGPLLRLPQRQLVEYLSQYGLCSLSTALYQWLPRALRRLPLHKEVRPLLQQLPLEAPTVKQHAILVPGRREQQKEQLEAKFGVHFTALFSDLSEADELKAWVAVATGQTTVGLGRERALFAPWCNLHRLTIIDPEDVFYYHEQSPYLNLREAALALAEWTKAEVAIRSQLPEGAAQTAWGAAAEGIDPLPPVRLLDLRVEPLLNVELLAAIRATILNNKRVILLYNAKDRNVTEKKDGFLQMKRLPGIESLQKKLREELGVPIKSGQLIIGTRSILSAHYDRVGLTVVLSLDPLLSQVHFSDQLHGWADLGHLFGYAAPCWIQVHDQDHPLVAALREGRITGYLSDQIKQQQQLDLPPFGQQIVCLAATEKLEAGSIEVFHKKLAAACQPPWQLSHPFSISLNQKETTCLLLKNSEKNKQQLPSRLRKLLISQPRPWKIQYNPERVIG